MKTYKPVKKFALGVRIAFSSAEDGCMPSGGRYVVTSVHRQAIATFLQKYGFQGDTSVKVGVMYEPESTYTHIERADEHTDWDTKADAVFTTVADKVIFLPVADCVATVVYDPIVRMVAVLHLGRHSSVAGLIEEFAVRVADELGSDPRDWHVWMSPSLQIESNGLDYFEPPHPERWVSYIRINADGKIHIDIPGHNRERFERMGVKSKNVYVSPIDTYRDKRYFSHRAATEGDQPDRQGRMIIAAAMTD